MPKLISLPPSKESTQPLVQPMSLVSRHLSANAKVQAHSHTWGQFVYASRGVLAVMTPDAKFIVPPEQGVWVRPNVSHSVIAITNVELTSFYFDHAQGEHLPQHSCVLNVDPFLQALVLEAKTLPADYEWHSSQGRLLRLIRDRLAQASDTQFNLPYSAHPKLVQLFNALRQAPENQETLAQWGARIGASSRTLSRLVMAETGLSYRHWRLRLKVQLSLELLAQGCSIGQIADTLGYASPSAFIHMFKQQTGYSPSRFRHSQ